MKIQRFLMAVEERLNPFFDWLEKKNESFFFFFRSMAAQQRSHWLKIGVASCEFVMASYMYFWSLGIQK